MTVYQFTDVTPGNEDPVYPAQIRATGQALSNTYYQLGADGSGNAYAVRGVLIYNDSNTTGIHVRIATASSGQDATQGDTYIGPDATGYFLIHRKDLSKTGNKLYVTAVADT